MPEVLREVAVMEDGSICMQGIKRRKEEEKNLQGEIT